MKKFIPFLALVVFSACGGSKKLVQSPSFSTVAQPVIDEVMQEFAPDQRTILFRITPRQNVLAGETTSAAAKTALLERLKKKQLEFVDSILVLPQASLVKRKAVVINSVANLRVQPRHQAELSTQATLGTPLDVLKKERGWYFVQTPDHYLAWVDGGAIEWMDSTAFANWQATPKIIYAKPYGFAYSKPDAASSTEADLVYGDIMAVRQRLPGFIEAAFPDGRIVFIAEQETMAYQQWMNSRYPTTENLIATARNLLGLPYLWGGTSFKGVDCSGFTRTVYFMNGLLLPRDASQQAQVGELVDTKNGWDQLQPGDLLFFGAAPRGDQPARVVHVGMWIGGNQEFIHSSGRVMVGSMNPAASNYDEGEHRRFLWARRIHAKDAVLDLRAISLYESR